MHLNNWSRSSNMSRRSIEPDLRRDSSSLNSDLFVVTVSDLSFKVEHSRFATIRKSE